MVVFTRIYFVINIRNDKKEVKEMSCYSEAEIAEVVIDIIRNNPGIRTSEMISEDRRIMEPSGEDLQILQDRNDDKFSQKVRNIKSHDTLTGMIRTVNKKNRQWYLL